MGAEVTGIFDIEILNYLSLGFVPKRYCFLGLKTQGLFVYFARAFFRASSNPSTSCLVVSQAHIHLT
jgi:hypothetical protein